MYSKKYGFTLVELIVVIVILSILATIAFLSFSNQSSSARDSTRLSDLSMVKKGLEVYNSIAGKYPTPENITGTGTINGINLIYVGNIHERISKIINLSKKPFDPLSGDTYPYGTDVVGKYYQIAAVLENQMTLSIPNLSTAYAEDSYNSKVSGNFMGLFKYSGSIYKVPGLIFTGNNNLISGETFFIEEGTNNLPYKLSSSDIGSTSSGSAIYAIIPTKEQWKAGSGTQLATLLGEDEDKMGLIIFGNNYLTNVKNSISSNPIIPSSVKLTNLKILNGLSTEMLLTGTFIADINNYSSNVDTATFAVTATLEDTNSTMELKIGSNSPIVLSNNMPSTIININEGQTIPIDVTITSNIGGITNSYTVDVTRPGSARLTSILIKTSPTTIKILAPTFYIDTLNYLSASITTTTFSVTAFLEDSNATMTLKVGTNDPILLTSGVASASISISAGQTIPVVLKVTPNGGGPTRSYTVNVPKS
ncbi:MAG: cadherin-like beta sandwich domain-containing protein [Candidatus Gracilibacteria bacterium]|nr:cadherin-like beta sandwich domain-containing protein [Candidatus Gracilibacteria bacterium]MDD2908690.1 cadherin-like beta sandwich domain-containing protein [Candidatus Gracilibacteria bacterium]